MLYSLLGDSHHTLGNLRTKPNSKEIYLTQNSFSKSHLLTSYRPQCSWKYTYIGTCWLSEKRNEFQNNWAGK